MGLALAKRQRRAIIGPKAPLTPIVLKGMHNYSSLPRPSLHTLHSLKVKTRILHINFYTFIVTLVGRICLNIGKVW